VCAGGVRALIAVEIQVKQLNLERKPAEIQRDKLIGMYDSRTATVDTSVIY